MKIGECRFVLGAVPLFGQGPRYCTPSSVQSWQFENLGPSRLELITEHIPGSQVELLPHLGWNPNLSLAPQRYRNSGLLTVAGS
jgi:hypothetical protein